MLNNKVLRDIEVNGKVDIIPYAEDHDDTLTTSIVDMVGRPNTTVAILLLGTTDSTTGSVKIEESDDQIVWTPVCCFNFVSSFATFQRTKRYLRVPDVGLETATTTIMSLTLLY